MHIEEVRRNVFQQLSCSGQVAKSSRNKAPLPLGRKSKKQKLSDNCCLPTIAVMTAHAALQELFQLGGFLAILKLTSGILLSSGSAVKELPEVRRQEAAALVGSCPCPAGARPGKEFS